MGAFVALVICTQALILNEESLPALSTKSILPALEPPAKAESTFTLVKLSQLEVTIVVFPEVPTALCVSVTAAPEFVAVSILPKVELTTDTKFSAASVALLPESNSL